MALSGCAIVTIMAILLKLVIMALFDMVTNMVKIGVYTKNIKIVDYLWKRNWKMCIGSKVMDKTKYFRKK